MYINTENNQYPVSERDIRAANPNTSFPSPFVAPEQYAPVLNSPQPAYNSVIQRVQETIPTPVNGTYMQQWQVVPKFVEYTDDEGVVHTVAEQEAAAIAADTAAKNEALFKSIQTQTQQRLDAFAQTRLYAGILSLCTYATSTNPKFQAEGQYGVEARDSTWATLYQILAEVEAGTRPIPAGYDDIEPELPVLQWPDGA
jgi:hypothetical protein